MWTENLYKELFGKDARQVSLPELLKGLSLWEHSLDKDPQKRPFAHLKRGPDGKFDDGELVHILTEAIEDTAGLIYSSQRHTTYTLISTQGLLGLTMFQRH